MNTDRFKFRVWDNAEQRYLNPKEFVMDSQGKIIFIALSISDHKQKDLIIEQCTCLKDKNGELIYEGDVLRHDFYGGGYCIRSVVRYEGGFFFCDDKDNLRHKAIHFALRGMMTQEVAKGFEIIGNVHEYERKENE